MYCTLGKKFQLGIQYFHLSANKLKLTYCVSFVVMCCVK